MGLIFGWRNRMGVEIFGGFFLEKPHGYLNSGFCEEVLE
jgi:hypothetical protein